MTIHIYDFTRSGLLDATAYRDSRDAGPLDGSVEDALRIVGELYATGLNVMLHHYGGTRDDHIIWVDDRRFQQR